jgi:hypothetical protein
MQSPIMMEMVGQEYASEARRNEAHRQLVKAAREAKTRSRASALWSTLVSGARRSASAIKLAGSRVTALGDASAAAQGQ